MQPSHAELMDQLRKGSERFSRIETLLSTVIEKVEPIPQMQADIASAKQDIAETRELVQAWTAIKTFGRFFKWASGVLAGVLAVTAIVRAAARGLL